MAIETRPNRTALANIPTNRYVPYLLFLLVNLYSKITKSNGTMIKRIAANTSATKDSPDNIDVGLISKFNISNDTSSSDSVLADYNTILMRLSLRSLLRN